MAYRWVTANSVWLEEEHNRFELEAGRDLARIDWQRARGRLPDVAQLLGAALPASCAHAAIYPEGFAFCPDCGAQLSPTSPPSRPAWWGATTGTIAAEDAPLPRHVPHGLAQTALPLAASLETRPPEPARGQAELKIPAPPNAVCVFAAANFGFAAQRLLALAFTRNVLQYWDPLAQRWHVMTPEGDGITADLRFTSSQYAWLPLAQPERRGEVALVPSQDGLFRLLIDPVSETFRTEPLLQAPLVASPGAVNRRVATLFLSGAHYSRSVRLWTAAFDGADPEVLDIDSADPAIAIPAEGWARPYSYDGQLCWLHDAGQLLWRPGSVPRWLPWPFPWQPRLQFGGPARSRDGRLWLIGHDGADYSFRELGTEGVAQVMPIEGARLGFGTLLFRRGHQVKDDPWAVEDVEDQTRGDALVLPLLENAGGARSQPSGLVLRFEQFTGRAEAAMAGDVLPRVIVEWVGQRNVILDEVARLKHPGDCVPFVYDGSLWLHHPTWNEIRGWRLKGFA